MVVDENLKKLPVSTLEFKSIHPVEAGEEWAMELDNPPRVVEIYIDGREMADTIAAIERPYKEEEGLDLDVEDYGHLPAADLYGELSMATDEIYGSEVYLFCCRSCGEPGCWSVTCRVAEDEEYVYWYDFEHEHRDWEYHLRYKFEKCQYDESLGKLKRMADSQKRR